MIGLMSFILLEASLGTPENLGSTSWDLTDTFLQGLGEAKDFLMPVLALTPALGPATLRLMPWHFVGANIVW